jgi:hypothetical protein
MPFGFPSETAFGFAGILTELTHSPVRSAHQFQRLRSAFEMAVQ